MTSIAFAFLFSVDIALIPLVDYSKMGIEKLPSYLISVFLFLSFILELFSLHKTKEYRWLAQRQMGCGRLRRYKLNMGLINFFTSKEAILADALLFFSILIVVLVSLFFSDKSFTVAISVAFMVFLIQMHSILNGKIYIDLKLLEKRKFQNE